MFLSARKVALDTEKRAPPKSAFVRITIDRLLSSLKRVRIYNVIG